jgi:hypothetical protein
LILTPKNRQNVERHKLTQQWKVKLIKSHKYLSKLSSINLSQNIRNFKILSSNVFCMRTLLVIKIHTIEHNLSKMFLLNKIMPLKFKKIHLLKSNLNKSCLNLVLKSQFQWLREKKFNWFVLILAMPQSIHLKNL